MFFFNDPATPEIYTLSLPDALPISRHREPRTVQDRDQVVDGHQMDRVGAGHDGALGRGERRSLFEREGEPPAGPDRKSTRLNSSHANISYAVFCLKKKKKNYSYKL